MSKYYLIARDRVSNDFQTLPVNEKKGCALEEIDLFTIGFQNSEDLAKYYQEHGLTYPNVDFFIASQNKLNGEVYLKKQELLFANNSVVRDIAENSLKKRIEDSSPQIDKILDTFADKVFQDSILFDQVMTGKTNVYDKYAKYFAFTRYASTSRIKYRDGAWARTCYPLIRNILEAMSRKNRRYARMSDDLFRGLLDDKLQRITAPGYNENQYNMFDQFPGIVPEEDINDKIVEVMSMIEKLPRDTFVIKDEHTSFNQQTFPLYAEGDLEKFETYIPESLRYGIQLFTMHRDYLENEPQKFGDAYQVPIREGLKTMIEVFRTQPEVLERTYLWCQLYGEYKDKVLGDVHGREYQKGREEN